MNRSDPSPWPEAATVVVSGLLGVLAALMAVLLLSDEGAPNTPRSVEGVEVTRVLNPDSMNV